MLPPALYDMNPKLDHAQSPALRRSPYQGSALEMMVHDLVNMVQAGRETLAKTESLRLIDR